MRRIILYGPPVCGKTTMLKGFAEARGLGMYQFNPLEGATNEHILEGLPISGHGADVIDRGQRVYDRSLDVGLATIWGPFWNRNSWPQMLSRADAIVLALDPQASRESADADCIEIVNGLRREIRGCVVWTKQDLVEAGEETVSTKLIERGVVGTWPVFRSRHDRPRTLVAPIEHLVSELAKIVD